MRRNFIAFLLVVGCGGANRRTPPTVAPGPPIVADAPDQLGAADKECDGLLAALEHYRACDNLDDDDRHGLDADIEAARRDFIAAHKSDAPAAEQAEIAAACHRATRSVRDAATRCAAGRAIPED
jgi:hypothetical protein